jgi:hypothetical protein
MNISNTPEKILQPNCSIEILLEKANCLIFKHRHFSDPEVGSDVS